MMLPKFQPRHVAPIVQNLDLTKGQDLPTTFGKAITFTDLVARPLSYWVGEPIGLPNDSAAFYPAGGNKDSILYGDAQEQEFPIPAQGISLRVKQLARTYVRAQNEGDILYGGTGGLNSGPSSGGGSPLITDPNGTFTLILNITPGFPWQHQVNTGASQALNLSDALAIVNPAHNYVAQNAFQTVTYNSEAGEILGLGYVLFTAAQYAFALAHEDFDQFVYGAGQYTNEGSPLSIPATPASGTKSGNLATGLWSIAAGAGTWYFDIQGNETNPGSGSYTVLNLVSCSCVFSGSWS